MVGQLRSDGGPAHCERAIHSTHPDAVSRSQEPSAVLSEHLILLEGLVPDLIDSLSEQSKSRGNCGLRDVQVELNSISLHRGSPLYSTLVSSITSVWFQAFPADCLRDS